MEEEFQGGVCGGSWWNPSRNLFGSSPCSASEWLNPSLILDTKAAKTISGDSGGSASDGASSVVLQETPISQPQFNLPIGSTFHMMADDWNQDFLNDSARSQQNYSLNSSINCRHEWTTTTTDFSADSSPNLFRLVQQQQQQPPNTYSTSAGVSPLNRASYNYTSSLLHTLFDADSQPLLGNEATDFRMSSAAAVPTFSGAAATKPSFPKQQLVNNYQFINSSTNFWNATAAASSGEVRASFLPSSTPQLIPSPLTKPKHTQQNLSSKNRYAKAGEADAAAKRCGNEGALKRPRIETPSPLPTFKVRKEKLGDRVTALQQLVSPFGKTDTASVLHEAIDYIKLLHDQVTVLSTPYLKNGPPPLQRQQASDKMKDEEEAAKDLRSRGLCLVPISSTFPMATETTADFWTPTFGASFR